MASELETKALKEAKDLATQLIARHKGDENAIRGELNKMYARDVPTHTGEAAIAKMRMFELARAYVPIADGKGGIDAHASTRERERFQAAIDGHLGDSNRSPLPSQQEALRLNRPDLATEHLQERVGKVSRVSAEHQVRADHGLGNKQRGRAEVGMLVGMAALGAAAALLTSQNAHALPPRHEDKATMAPPATLPARKPGGPSGP